MRRTSAITITGTWSTACTGRALQHNRCPCRIVECCIRKHFPTPVTSSCNVTDSALQRVTAWQWTCPSQDVTGCCPIFSPCNVPSVPRVSPQCLSLAASLDHTWPIFGGIVSVPSFLYSHDICPMYHHAATQLRSNLYRILEKESKRLYHARKNVAAAVAVLTSLSHCK